jgi:hypothetical protein
MVRVTVRLRRATKEFAEVHDAVGNKMQIPHP